MSSLIKRKVYYICDTEVIKACDRLPKVTNRASMTHDLIEAYDLLKHLKCITHVKAATYQDVTQFHSRDFVDALLKLDESNPDIVESGAGLDEYGLGYDCIVYRGIYTDALSVAGGTLGAADCLIRYSDSTAVVVGGDDGGDIVSQSERRTSPRKQKFQRTSRELKRSPSESTGDGAGDKKKRVCPSESAPIVINWNGGWHHAMRFSAAGYCYLNDIVLAIMRLQSCFSRILYVDLDLHHGDGVQDAFFCTDKVFTLSFHRYSLAFYPGTGSLDERGVGKGKGYTVNVPLKESYRDEQFIDLYKRIVPGIIASYKPDCIVCQCGGDALSTDPHMEANLTAKAYRYAVGQLSSISDTPLMLLGGGGYNFADTAKLWTILTADVVGQRDLPSDIPDHKMMDHYGPCYSLDIEAGIRRSDNSAAYLKSVVDTIVSHTASESSPAPVTGSDP